MRQRTAPPPPLRPTCCVTGGRPGACPPAPATTLLPPAHALAGTASGALAAPPPPPLRSNALINPPNPADSRRRARQVQGPQERPLLRQRRGAAADQAQPGPACGSRAAARRAPQAAQRDCGGRGGAGGGPVRADQGGGALMQRPAAARSGPVHASMAAVPWAWLCGQAWRLQGWGAGRVSGCAEEAPTPAACALASIWVTPPRQLHAGGRARRQVLLDCLHPCCVMLSQRPGVTVVARPPPCRCVRDSHSQAAKSWSCQPGAQTPVRRACGASQRGARGWMAGWICAQLARYMLRPGQGKVFKPSRVNQLWPHCLRCAGTARLEPIPTAQLLYSPPPSEPGQRKGMTATTACAAAACAGAQTAPGRSSPGAACA
jgi:hypothetical protein